MAFVQTDVNYAAEYSGALAQAYPYLSYFGAIWASPNSALYKPGMGKTMYIPTLSVSGAKAVDRNRISGAFDRNWNNAMQTVTLRMDREWDTLVDPADVAESGDVATIAGITRVFNETQKVPEMDAYMAMKLAGFAADFGGVDTTVLTRDNILAQWDAYLEYMSNQRVNRDRVVAYMTPGTYRLLKNAAGITRFVAADTGARSVDRNVGSLDGVRIVEVPADMMKTAYLFDEGWAVDGERAQQINLLLVDPMAVAAPVKYETAMMSAPTAQSRGKYLYYERYYYDVFRLDQRQAGFFVNLGASPSLGSLTLVSAAGDKAGASSVTVSGGGIPGGSPVEGLELFYSAGNSAAVALSYGAPLPGGATWSEAKASPIEPCGQTAGKFVTAALVNRQTGNVVAGGSTTLVVGS